MRVNLIILGNYIFDGTGCPPFAGGLAISGNKIVAVGSREEILSYKDDDTRCLDFENELIMPGFHDAHMHYFMGAIVDSKHVVDVRDAKTPEECCSRIKKYADEHPQVKAIFGAGWFSHNWENDTRATKELIDRYVSDRPVVLMCADFHTYWLNTEALKACGFNENTTFQTGELEKYENGMPTGMVFEIEAGKIVTEFMLSSFTNEQKIEMQKAFQDGLSSYGITSTTDMACEPTLMESTANYEAAQALADGGESKVRVFFYPSLGLTEDFSKQRKLKDTYAGMFVRMSGLKQFVDGVSSTWTGYMLEPYEDHPDTCGYPFVEPELLEKLILTANEQGMNVRLHTLGDAAIRLSLDIFEKSRKENPDFEGRNSLEHVETIHPDDICRFKSTDTVCSMQPEHLILERGEKVDRLGVERCKYEWPFRSLADARAILALGTDYPVVHYDPFTNLYAAVERLFPEGTAASVNQNEKISMEEALKAYTLGSAYANGVEDKLGSLEAGKLADVIVLDRNLFEVSSDEIKETKVKMTISDGRIVYKGDEDL